MSSQIAAAIIAGAVTLISVIGTLVVARWGFKATMRAAKMAADEAHKDTDKTLSEQRLQLERTLGEQHARTLNERFATAAGQLGGDNPPAVRLAGVYAMAGLADDWEDNRQRCIDVLCAYMRLPYEPNPGEDAGTAERAIWLGNREVRHTVLRVIGRHLRSTDRQVSYLASWCGMDFDFTGVVFDGGDFSYGEFSGGRVSFIEAEFADGTVYFTGAKFTAGRVSFDGARFTGGTVDFRNCHVVGGSPDANPEPLTKRTAGSGVDIRETDYAGDYLAFGPMSFIRTQFALGGFDFSGASFSGGTVDFRNARFEDFYAGFSDVDFNGGTVSFEEAQFTGDAIHFERARFGGGLIEFSGARFYGSDCIAYFRDAEFTGASVQFRGVKFAAPCYVDFNGAQFAGGVVDFSEARFAGARVNLKSTRFAGSSIIFKNTEYYGRVHIDFDDAGLNSGSLDFANARFLSGIVDFSRARFAGSTVDFSKVAEWQKPPLLPDYEEGLPGLLMPN